MTIHDTARPLSFESMLSDPLIRLVMAADGVTEAEFVSVMCAARAAVVARAPAATVHCLRAATA